MKRIFFLLAIGILVCANPVRAYSNPGNPTGHINDFAKVLTIDQTQTLETKLSEFEKNTQHQISVVTVTTLDGDTIENYAVKLFEDWGIGKKNYDNGVLLLIAVQEREVRIEVGYGLEGDLTDAQSYWIIQNQIIPEFKQNNYYQGIDNGITQIISAAQGSKIPESSNQAPDENLLMWGLVLGGYLLSWLAGILGRSKSWYTGGIIGACSGILLTAIHLGKTIGIPITIGLTLFGFLFDYIVSHTYQQRIAENKSLPWWTGGNIGRSSGGSSFGGFSGGRSGGGGASGRW